MTEKKINSVYIKILSTYNFLINDIEKKIIELNNNINIDINSPQIHRSKLISDIIKNINDISNKNINDVNVGYDKLLFITFKYLIYIIFLQNDYKEILYNINSLNEKNTLDKIIQNNIKNNITDFFKIDIYTSIKSLIEDYINYYNEISDLNEIITEINKNKYYDQNEIVNNGNDPLIIIENFAIRQMKYLQKNILSHKMIGNNNLDKIQTNILSEVQKCISTNSEANNITPNIVQAFLRFPFGLNYNANYISLDNISDNIVIIILNESKEKNNGTNRNEEYIIPNISYSSPVELMYSDYKKIMNHNKSVLKVLKLRLMRSNTISERELISSKINDIENSVRYGENSLNIISMNNSGNSNKIASNKNITRFMDIDYNNNLSLTNMINLKYNKKPINTIEDIKDIKLEDIKGYCVLWKYGNNYIPLMNNGGEYIHKLYNDVPNSLVLYKMLCNISGIKNNIKILNNIGINVPGDISNINIDIISNINSLQI